MKKSGFTLIEAIIVVIILAIFIAFITPSILRAKMAKNEGAAAGSLKTLNGMFATFKKKGYSYTGKRYPHALPNPDGWGSTNAGKFAGLYYESGCAGEQITLIGAAEAGADFRADGDTDRSEDNGFFYGSTNIDADGLPTFASCFAVTFSCKAKQGYWFGLFNRMAGPGGYTYDVDAARNHYGLHAIPADYGSSGEFTFIINEEGTVYDVDRGESGFLESYPTVTPLDLNWEVSE